MALTNFGKAIRKGRIDINSTLRAMAEQLGTSPSFLSGLETGTKKISTVWLKKIELFFTEYDYKIEELKELADLSNESVHLHDGLSHQQKMLVAGFANSPFKPEELKMFADLLKEINEKSEEDD
jgi:transcriptional regulator with XRE-family HTH domain